MINVYVGGASANLRRARRFLARVRAHPDMTVSYNWIPSVEQARREGISDEDLARKDRRNIAEGCLNGIAEADAACFLLEPDLVSRGVYVELGYALALLETPTDPLAFVLVSGGRRRSVFSAEGITTHEFCDHRDDVDNDGRTFAALCELSRCKVEA